MAEPSNAAVPEEELSSSRVRARPGEEPPASIVLVSYPKIVFLYPSFLASLAAAIYLSFAGHPLDVANRAPVMVSIVFLAVLAMNLVVLGFDFPRTTSLTFRHASGPLGNAVQR